MFLTREPSPIQSEEDAQRILNIINATDIAQYDAALAVAFTRKGVDTLTDVTIPNSSYRTEWDDEYVLTLQVRVGKFASGYAEVKELVDEVVAEHAVREENARQALIAEKEAEIARLNQEIESLNA